MARGGLNQSHTVAELAREAGELPAIPAGADLTEEEKRLWPIFASARVASDWRPIDLFLLADVVRAEAMMRRCQRDLDKEGPVVPGARGALRVNPLHGIIDKLQRQQLALIRALKLNARPDGRTTAAHAAKAGRLAGDPFAEYNVDGLLARGRRPGTN